MKLFFKDKEEVVPIQLELLNSGYVGIPLSTWDKLSGIEQRVCRIFLEIRKKHHALPVASKDIRTHTLFDIASGLEEEDRLEKAEKLRVMVEERSTWPTHLLG